MHQLVQQNAQALQEVDAILHLGDMIVPQLDG
jgi:hypothetical protein